MGDKDKDNECVSVVVRCRPMNRKEKDESRGNIIAVDLPSRQVSITNPNDPTENPKSFTYDGAYDEHTQQRNFYEESCFGIVESVLEGFNGTIFAYGQTGCGKSFTMQGPPGGPEMRGVIPNSFSHIFDSVKASTEVQYLIRCSYLEIYNEEIKDLLGNQKDPTKCDIKEDPHKGVFVKGLTDVVVDTEDQLMAMLEKGISFRTVAATQMNAESSRSHSIFTVVVEMSSVDKDSGKEMLRAGKLNLVDLAGSERQKKTGASGALLKEGAKINLSLSALGNVISALSEGGKVKHIPYRDSKLTRMLQDSLGGNTKTLMVAAISPADYNYEETMSTLRYANRAKNIKNKPKINEDPKDTMLREFKEEIERLRKMLADRDGSVIKDFVDNGGHGGGGHGGQGVGAQQSLSPSRMAKAAKSMLDSDADTELSPGNGARHANDGHRQQQRAMGGGGYGDSERSDLSFEQRKALEEQALAAAEERDFVSQQLREKESEIEQERRMREDLMQRLTALQQHVVGNDQTDSAFSTMPSISGHGTVPTKTVLSEEELQKNMVEQEAAKKSLRERRLRAKKKREEQQAAEMARVLQEKDAMEEELEELKNNAATVGTAMPVGTMYTEEEMEEIVEKRVTKLKKKYQKQIAALKSDLQEVKDEFSYQRQMLVDALSEQEKDSKLFEMACRMLLSDREMKKLVDKSKWMEDEEEWIIPSLKRTDRGGDTAGALPDIGNQINPNGQGKSSSAARDNSASDSGGSGSANTGSAMYPPINPRGGNGNAMPMGHIPRPSSHSNNDNNNNQLPPTIRAANPQQSSMGGYNGGGGGGGGGSALPSLGGASSSSSVLPSIGAGNRSRSRSPGLEKQLEQSSSMQDDRKAYDGSDSARESVNTQQRLAQIHGTGTNSRQGQNSNDQQPQRMSRPTSKHGRPGSSTNQYVSLPAQGPGHYNNYQQHDDYNNNTSDYAAVDNAVPDKKKKKRRKKKPKASDPNNANLGGMDEWGFVVDGSSDLQEGEPEYSDDEDFEGAGSGMVDDAYHTAPGQGPGPGQGQGYQNFPGVGNASGPGIGYEAKPNERAKSRRGERERGSRGDRGDGQYDNNNDVGIGYNDGERAKSRRGERNNRGGGGGGGNSDNYSDSGSTTSRDTSFPSVSHSSFMPPIDNRSQGGSSLPNGKSSGGGGSALGSLPQIGR